MIEEQQARDWLQSAADTVDVGPSGPLDVAAAPRPRWVVPAVAAAAAVLVVGSLAGVVGFRGSSAPGPTSSGSPSEVPGVATPDDGAFRLGPDQVPSVFGQTTTSATALLRGAGLTVSVSAVGSCRVPRGVPLRTTPHTGTVFAAGDPVTLVVSSGSATLDCVAGPDAGPAAYVMLRAATGAGPLPSVTTGVDLDPALALLRTWASEIRLYDGGKMAFDTPTLRSAPPRDCALVEHLGEHLGGQLRWVPVSVALPDVRPGVDFVLPADCQTIEIGVDTEGRIANVSIPRAARRYFGSSPTSSIDVIGNSLPSATARLDAAGFHAVGVPRTDCQTLGLVSEQYPFLDEPVATGSTVYVAYTATTGPCLDSAHSLEFPGHPIIPSGPSTPSPSSRPTS